MSYLDMESKIQAETSHSKELELEGYLRAFDSSGSSEDEFIGHESLELHNELFKRLQSFFSDKEQLKIKIGSATFERSHIVKALCFEDGNISKIVRYPMEFEHYRRTSILSISSHDVIPDDENFLEQSEEEDDADAAYQPNKSERKRF